MIYKVHVTGEYDDSLRLAFLESKKRPYGRNCNGYAISYTHGVKPAAGWYFVTGEFRYESDLMMSVMEPKSMVWISDRRAPDTGIITVTGTDTGYVWAVFRRGEYGVKLEFTTQQNRIGVSTQLEKLEQFLRQNAEKITEEPLTRHMGDLRYNVQKEEEVL